MNLLFFNNRLYDGKQSPEHSLIEEDDDEDDDDESGTFHQVKSESVVKARHIESSAGTHRLQRILNKQQHELMMQQHQEAVVAAGGAGINSAAGTAAAGGGKVGGGGAGDPTTDPNSLLLAGMHRPRHFEKLSDPKDTRQVRADLDRVFMFLRTALILFTLPLSPSSQPTWLSLSHRWQD